MATGHLHDDHVCCHLIGSICFRHLIKERGLNGQPITTWWWVESVCRGGSWIDLVGPHAMWWSVRDVWLSQGSLQLPPPGEADCQGGWGIWGSLQLCKVPVVVAIHIPGAEYRKWGMSSSWRSPVSQCWSVELLKQLTYWQDKLVRAQAAPEAKTRVWKEFDEAMEDYQSASKKILSSCPPPQEGGAVLCQHCLQCRTGGVDLNWGHCLMVKGIIREAPQSPTRLTLRKPGTRWWTRPWPKYWGGLQPSVKWNGEMEWDIDRQIGAISAARQSVYRTFEVQEELSQNAKLFTSLHTYFHSWSWTLDGYWKGQGWDAQSLGESSK